MEFSVVLYLLACLFATTRSRSLVQDSSTLDSPRLKAFEAKFLQMLGMKEKPRITRKAIVPQYMLDLYNSRVEDPEYITTNLIFKDFATTANTVRAFHHKDTPLKDGDDVNRHKRSVHLDISSVPSHEELVKAEFRVYNNRCSTDLALGKHVINVYQVILTGERKLLDSKVVNVSTIGWQSYDILQAVQHWHKTPGENHGLELEIMSENGHPIDISHLHFDKPHEMAEEQWPHQRPLLALYSRNPNTHLHKKRERRSASKSWSRPKQLCKRFDLIVDFVLLKWKWVIQPTKYNAYMCKGKCEYPIASHLNTTNHAMVQTLVNSVRKHGNTVPPACCVPTELAPTMLLLDSSNGIEIKNYPEMSVVGCGCR